MYKIRTVEQLVERQRQLAPRMESRLNGHGTEIRERMILVCGGTGCQAYGCQEVIEAFDAELKKNKRPCGVRK